MCFAFIAALFLLINAFLESGSTLTALAVAAVQVVLFVLVNLFFNVKSRTKKRMILKYVISAIGIFAVTITFLGVFFNDNYSMYMFDGEETGSSFLDTTVDTTPRLVYAFLQLLPVLMYAAIAFKRAYLFPAASAFAAFGIIANNTSMAFGPFSVVRKGAPPPLLRRIV